MKQISAKLPKLEHVLFARYNMEYSQPCSKPARFIQHWNKTCMQSCHLERIARMEIGVIYQYLKNLSVGRAVLWCYLIWYLVTLAHHFDPSPRLWLNSLGISAVIGIGLVLSVSSEGGIKSLDRWQLMRLFLMPFCVSSFAALTKTRGFMLVFSTDLSELGVALLCCTGFLVGVLVAKHAPWVVRRIKPRAPQGRRPSLGAHSIGAHPDER